MVAMPNTSWFCTSFSLLVRIAKIIKKKACDKMAIIAHVIIAPTVLDISLYVLTTNAHHEAMETIIIAYRPNDGAIECPKTFFLSLNNINA